MVPCNLKMKKKNIKNKSGLTIHPLFLLVGIYYAFKGELMIFLLSTLVALQHELAHAIEASKLGYRLDRVVLMPFGALIDGDLEGLTNKDELKVALAGPFCNLCTAIFFLAIWWLYPSAYPFTDTAFYASLTIFFVNLIPAYPLDGGRVLKNLLFTHFLKAGETQKAREKSDKICKKITVCFSLVCLAIFTVFCFQKKTNFTLLFFAFFLLVSALKKTNDSQYVKIEFSQKKALERGMVVKRVAVLSTVTLKRALSFLSEGEYVVFVIYDENERFLGEITQNRLAELLMEQDLYTPLGNWI